MWSLLPKSKVGDHFAVIEKSINVAETGDVTIGIISKKIDSQHLNITPAKTINDFVNNLFLTTVIIIVIFLTTFFLLLLPVI